MAQNAQAAGSPPFGIVIHGGAGTIDKAQMTPQRETAYRTALTEALDAGYAILRRGGTSLDAVTVAVSLLEDSPLFNAGKGAVLNLDGKAELDASIMDGRTLDAGAVTLITETKNPILLARAVMEKSPHVMLAGEGAEAFARAQQLERVPNSYFETERRRTEWERARERPKSPGPRDGKRGDASDKEKSDAGFGTVGAVALDQHGNLAAATSTGGRLNKTPGRVGDTPIIGSGTYANNRTCAVSGTGHGEFFMRAVAGHAISALVEHAGKEIEAAAGTVIRDIEKLGGSGGVIAIDKSGKIAMPFTTSGMYRGFRLSGGEPSVAIWKE
jgi:L-asparaginase / beta-aspartyl-peptidase